MSSAGNPEIVVVGGGAVGCATALELARRGHQIRLVERDALASHASGFAYGGLFPTTGVGIPGPLLGPAKEAVARHEILAKELPETTGVATQFRRSRSVDLAVTNAELRDARANADWQRREGFDVTELPPEDLASYEPFVTTNIAGGVLHRSHYEIDSYRYVLALATAFERAGGVIQHGTVTGVTRRGSQVELVLDSGDRLDAEHVVLCLGPWAGDETRPGIPPLPIRPVRGEILRLNFPGDSFAARITHGNAYIARKPDGLVWVGTTHDEAGFEERPTDAARTAILREVLQLAPALQDAEVVQHTACLRPVSADGFPVIGEVARSVFVANGAGSKGILLSPVMAQWAADALEGNAASIPEPFQVERYL